MTAQNTYRGGTPPNGITDKKADRKGGGPDVFTVNDGIPFWGLGDHETLIVALAIPVVTLSGWKRPCTVRESDLESAMVRSLDR